MHTWRTLFILITSYIPRVNYKHYASVRFAVACYIVTNPWVIVCKQRHNSRYSVSTKNDQYCTSTTILSACPSIHNNTRSVDQTIQQYLLWCYHRTKILPGLLPLHNNILSVATPTQQYVLTVLPPLKNNTRSVATTATGVSESSYAIPLQC